MRIGSHGVPPFVPASLPAKPCGESPAPHASARGEGSDESATSARGAVASHAGMLRALSGPESRSDRAVAPAPNAGMLRALYATGVGAVLRPIVTSRCASLLPGFLMDTRLSSALIRPFMRAYRIDLSECARPDPSLYASFNDFFARELRPGARPIEHDSRVMTSPADSRVLALQPVQSGDEFLVKGVPFDLSRFLDDRELARSFEGGAMVICRLSPDDYHRFHFPVSGTPSAPRRIRGRFDSVDPLVFDAGVLPLLENERHVITVDSPLFSKVAIVPVGALAVGKIVETYPSGREAAKGDEAGFFKFGGSTVVVVFQPQRVELDARLLERSARRVETFVRMGSPLGVRAKSSERTV